MQNFYCSMQFFWFVSYIWPLISIHWTLFSCLERNFLVMIHLFPYQNKRICLWTKCLRSSFTSSITINEWLNELYFLQKKWKSTPNENCEIVKTAIGMSKLFEICFRNNRNNGMNISHTYRKLSFEMVASLINKCKPISFNYTFLNLWFRTFQCPFLKLIQLF